MDDIGEFDYVYGAMILHHLEPFKKLAKNLSMINLKEQIAYLFYNR